MDNKVLIFILLFQLLTVADESQEVSEATRTANPCLYDEQFKEFDFSQRNNPGAARLRFNRELGQRLGWWWRHRRGYASARYDTWLPWFEGFYTRVGMQDQEVVKRI